MPAPPARILTVNAGSSSLKLRLLDEHDEVAVERESSFRGDAAELRSELEAILAEGPPIDAAGHRVVHGGPDFTATTVVDPGVERDLEGLADLAPLHNPPAVAAMRALASLLPDLPTVACFDTAFHAGMPPAASTYAVPSAWTERWPLRRYGFHGLSHSYASRRAAELLARPLEQLRLVTAHLGAGASLAAVEGGRSVDTTMGYSPLEGLVMATRSGSVDPGLLLWVQRHGDLSPDAVERALDRESGLLALCGRSDMREVITGVDAGDRGCVLAFDVYMHRLNAGIAAMAAAMGGIDALVFTGGVGERSARVRSSACRSLAFLGIDPSLDDEAEATGDCLTSTHGAAVAVAVVEAREDVEIARQVRAALGSDQS